MNMAPKQSVSEEFELGRCTGREEEGARMTRKLHQVRECLNAASFAIESAKTPDAPQTELVSRASKLLTEAMELLREGLEGQKDENSQGCQVPE
jgi:hypothetical protein